jgi:hypothetical protein
MDPEALATPAYEHAIKLAQIVGPAAAASAAKSTAIIEHIKRIAPALHEGAETEATPT